MQGHKHLMPLPSLASQSHVTTEMSVNKGNCLRGFGRRLQTFQLPAFSEDGLASQSTHPRRTNVKQMNAIELQHNEPQVFEDQPLCFGGRYGRQRTLVIRIAAITLASGSAITIA